MGGEVLKAQYTHPVSGVTMMVPVKCGTDGSLAVTGGGGVATDVKPCNDGITQLPILSDAAGQIYIGHDGANEQFILTDNTGAIILASGNSAMVCDDPLAGGPYYASSDVNGQLFMAHDGANPQLLLSDANGVLYLGWDGAAARRLKTDAAGQLEIVGSGVAMVGDDGLAGGPYYLLTDVAGQLMLGHDGANPFVLKTDAGGTLQVDIEGPLSSQLEAASVSIAPPTDARFQVSKDANVNAEGNPIFVRVSDSLNSADVVAAGADNEANAIKGLVTYSRQMGYDGATWDRVGVTAGALDNYLTGPLGSAAHANSVSTAPATDARYQVSADANSNTLANPMFIQISQDGTNEVDATHPLPVSKDMAANLTGNRLWVTSDVDMLGGNAINTNGGNVDAGTQTITLADNDKAVTSLEIMDDWDDGADHCQVDIAVQSVGSVAVSKDNVANAVANTLHVELSDGAAAFLDNTASPGYIRLQDGDSTVLADILDDLPTTTLAGTTNSLVTTSLMVGYDEAAFRPVIVSTDGQLAVGTDGSDPKVLKTDVNGQLYVLQGALLPGEDSGNDWRKVKKEEIATYSPAKTGGTVVDETPDLILAALEVLNMPNFTIWVKNVGGGTGDPLTDVDVQASPDSANWVSLTSTGADTLTSGNTGIAYEANAASYRYIRVYANAGAGNDTTVDCWITANKG